MNRKNYLLSYQLVVSSLLCLSSTPSQTPNLLPTAVPQKDAMMLCLTTRPSLFFVPGPWHILKLL